MEDGVESHIAPLFLSVPIEPGFYLHFPMPIPVACFLDLDAGPNPVVSGVMDKN